MKYNITRTALVVGILSICFTISTQAAQFFVTGTVNRILSDGQNYGGCMVELSTPVNNSCPANGWISLDCQSKFQNGGERHFASALTALSLGKTVSVMVDNALKHDGYCVGRRLDVLK